jgi:competence protein ComEA
MDDGRSLDDNGVVSRREPIAQWWAGIDRRAAIGVGAAAIALALGAAWWRQSTPASLPPPSAGISSHARHPSTTSKSSAAVVVDVVGAVMRPGVVSLPAGARVVDAIDAAGGALTVADVEQLDLAAHAVDGARIYVPRRGEHVDPSLSGGGAPGDPNAGSADGPATPAAPINLNTATQAQLETLPGIGPSLARAIIAERVRRGGFRRVADLGSVRGIGPRRLAELQPLVTV